ncbi:MAG: glucose-1-phosphate adenylyltransferase [Elusimicrobiaceae bacterium]|nr:glucose-1-phosphate adenylyltransferase [Elusimicrobiaceae bacterium]
MRILGVIMAGGKGERLYPLTKERSKPAVPFGGKYRIADFVMSNFVNSGIFASYVLVQYLSQSLIDYLRQSWPTRGLTNDHFITVVPPQMRMGEVWYRGTADAVRQNLSLITDFAPDLVAVFGADHIYRMDIGQMIDFHLKNKADVTIAALPVPLKEATQFGVVAVDAKNRVTGFLEKIPNPPPIPGNPTMAYASMGNYIFSYDALVKILHEKYAESPGLDFGKGIMPIIHKRYNVFAYDFPSQKLPGIQDYEEEGYWRDVGTIAAFWEANMDLLGTKPKMDLNNPKWPIHSGSHNSPPAKYVGAEIKDSMISDGCVIKNSVIKHSILGRGVVVREKCEIEDCIIMDYCEIKPGTRLKKAVVDRFNVLGPKLTVGHDPAEDAQRYYIDPSGIVVIPRGKTKFL